MLQLHVHHLLALADVLSQRGVVQLDVVRVRITCMTALMLMLMLIYCAETAGIERRVKSRRPAAVTCLQGRVQCTMTQVAGPTSCTIQHLSDVAMTDLGESGGKDEEDNDEEGIGKSVVCRAQAVLQWPGHIQAV